MLHKSCHTISSLSDLEKFMTNEHIIMSDSGLYTNKLEIICEDDTINWNIDFSFLDKRINNLLIQCKHLIINNRFPVVENLQICFESWEYHTDNLFPPMMRSVQWGVQTTGVATIKKHPIPLDFHKQVISKTTITKYHNINNFIHMNENLSHLRELSGLIVDKRRLGNFEKLEVQVNEPLTSNIFFGNELSTLIINSTTDEIIISNKYLETLIIRASCYLNLELNTPGLKKLRIDITTNEIEKFLSQIKFFSSIIFRSSKKITYVNTNPLYVTNFFNGSMCMEIRTK